MPNTVRQAVDWAAGQIAKPSQDWRGKCLVFSRTAYDVPAKYSTAAIAWAHTKNRHVSWPPPKGALVWWTGGSKGYGHVVISAGGGWCYSTDFVKPGSVNMVPIKEITSAWHQIYQGWTEDINDVHVWTDPIPHLVAHTVVQAMTNHDSLVYGVVLKKALAAEVGRGAMLTSNRTLGRASRHRWKLLQAKIHGGVPKDYTGIPTAVELVWLGKRHDFKVV